MKSLKKYGINSENTFYTIAEVGINHGGDEDLAKKMIDSAARSGADSVKFQTYLTEKRVPPNSPIYDILKKCELPLEVFSRLKKHSDSMGINFFSTPFDEESVDCLEDLDIGLYKVASFDVVNHKLLRYIAKTGKTIIMSVGMADLPEIKSAYDILKTGTDKIAILHCISSYPTQKDDANLSVINTLMNEFDCIIGQSDHTNDIKVPLYAAAMGAQIIEKHYKIDENMDCVDAPVSITEKQMSELGVELRKLEKILGNPSIGLFDVEKGAEQFRRPTD
tara:strand:+ start:942 stop:1775 length:834 start_codon:yes stop_codon:yes gene_type:complete